MGRSKSPFYQEMDYQNKLQKPVGQAFTITPANTNNNFPKPIPTVTGNLPTINNGPPPPGFNNPIVMNPGNNNNNNFAENPVYNNNNSTEDGQSGSNASGTPIPPSSLRPNSANINNQFSNNSRTMSYDNYPVPSSPYNNNNNSNQNSLSENPLVPGPTIQNRRIVPPGQMVPPPGPPIWENNNPQNNNLDNQNCFPAPMNNNFSNQNSMVAPQMSNNGPPNHQFDPNSQNNNQPILPNQNNQSIPQIINPSIKPPPNNTNNIPPMPEFESIYNNRLRYMNEDHRANRKLHHTSYLIFNEAMRWHQIYHRPFFNFDQQMELLTMLCHEFLPTSLNLKVRDNDNLENGEKENVNLTDKPNQLRQFQVHFENNQQLIFENSVNPAQTAMKLKNYPIPQIRSNSPLILYGKILHRAIYYYYMLNPYERDDRIIRLNAVVKFLKANEVPRV